MSKSAIIGGLGASATVLGIALAVTGGDSPSKLDTATSCSTVLAEHGSFLVPDDSGRCDLLYPPGQRMHCELEPVADVPYQWGYRATPLGIVTAGLRRGAVVRFECSEAK